MGIATYSYNRTTSGGEIVRELVNSTDGQGLHFDGVAGYIDIPTVPDLGTQFSFEFILQADSIASSGYNYIADFGNGGGRFSVLSYNGSLAAWDTGARTFGATFLDDLDVHHVVVTVDGTSAIAYDNGNIVGTATLGATSNIDSCTDAAIGSKYDGSFGYFNGTIYRARFWNRTLSEAEIKDSYDNPSVKFSNQYGSETDLNVMSCANGTTNPYTSFTSASATGFTAIQIGAVASSAGTADEIALVKGKDYRVTFYIANSSQAPKVSFAEDLNIGTPLQVIVGLGTLTSGTHTYDITYTGTTTTGVLVFENTAAASYAIANLSITRIGVVADLDLAFANMTQSDKVRDRSTNNVTGTASSGVTQVTPIEAVNTNKLNVGGTTPLVGIGLAAGVTPSQHLHIDNGTKPNVLLTRTTGVADTTTEMGSVFFGNQDTSKYLCAINGVQDGVKASGKLTFATQPNGGSRTDRMIIASDGLTTVKRPGWPMQNLLTNSGLSVWSNGTLLEVTSGAAPVTVGATAALVNNLVSNGGFDSDTAGWSSGSWTGGAAGSISNVSGGATGNCMQVTSTTNRWYAYREITGLTVGKLYKFSCWAKQVVGNGSVQLGTSAAGNQILASTTVTTSGGDYFSTTFEATGTSCHISFTANANGDDFLVDTVCLYEVTPGCVAADAKGPDGWTKNTGADVTRMHSDGASEAVTKKGSFYAAKIVSDGSPYYELYTKSYNEQDWIAKFLGRKVTFGCWVKTDAASQAKVNIFNNGNHFSTANTGTGWEWLEVTHTVDSSVGVRFGLYVTNTKTAYLSQPMLSFASALGEGNYSAPQGEIVWCENEVSSNLLNNTTGHSDVAWTSLNVEADSNGRIPKGAKAVAMQFRLRDSGSAAASEANLQLGAYTGGNNRQFAADIEGIADDKYQRKCGWVPCNTTGDPDYMIGASGSGTLDIPVAMYYGVELR